jgi:16S rRNA (guanine527-N7)-methyltransferase
MTGCSVPIAAIKWNPNKMDLHSGLISLLEETSLSLNTRQILQLVSYAQKLKELQRHSMASWDSDEKGLEMHFKDTFLSLPDFYPAFYADLGSGAGIPGIIYSILWPESKGVLIESQKKRCAFLEECIRELGFSGRIRVLHGRSEELAHLREWREQCDFITGRAFAPFPEFIEHAAAFIKTGACINALRGEKDREALQQYKRLLDFFHLTPEESFSYRLNPEASLRWVFRFKKKAPCPPRFPRKNNQIKKSSPLGENAG